MKIVMVDHPRKANDKQVYMQSFCDAWKESGGELYQPDPKMRMRLYRHFMKFIVKTGLYRRKHDKAFIVCSRGRHLLRSSIPYLFKGEIIPMLWDCWPASWDILEKDLRKLKCRLCFITSSAVVAEMQRRLPDICFVHVAEGVDDKDYNQGELLTNRKIDVFEVGRRHNYYHYRLINSGFESGHTFIHHNSPIKAKMNLTFDNWNDYTNTLSETKIGISFPNSLTNPKQKGHVETLTMRYWEQMLSRCVIVGHCPKELIDIIGYNPVIEADFVDPAQQLSNILEHISDYQEMVDRNYQTALTNASWSKRMPVILENVSKIY